MGTTVKEILWGKTTTFDVAHVEEAVELAQRLKSEGRYDWFRGQVRDRPPASSLHRIHASGDPVSQGRAVRRMHLFVEWVRKTPELEYLLLPEHVHDLFAIMQHYGIPTHYIDFTTDPAMAGFFAADTRTPPSEGRSCIYCLNTENLLSTWSDIKESGARGGASIEVVTIDVRNLWRLQAQRGVFVFADYNWDIDYPLDRITFPYTGYPTYPTSDRVYPAHKSPLEQLLDQYFSLETSTFVVEELRDMIERNKAQGGNAHFAQLETWEEGYYAEAFPDKSRIVPLASWSSEALRTWDVDPEEDYFETAGQTIRLRLKPTTGPAELRRQLSFGVKQILRSDPDVRSKAVDWEVADLPEKVSLARLNNLLRPAWNGMRRLPYSDAEIADALGSILALLTTGAGQAVNSATDQELFSQHFGESINVEFGYRDGSGSRGYVSRKRLADALRVDMADLLSPDHRERPGDLRELFRVIYKPSLMFDFEPFKIAFASEIIPAQVLLQRSPILFNPARLATFGNP